MKQPEHSRPFAQQKPVSVRRGISIGLVAALHVFVIYALASGLATEFVNKLPSELKAQVVQQQQVKPKAPPPPPPQLVKAAAALCPAAGIFDPVERAVDSDGDPQVPGKRAPPPKPVARIIPPRPTGRRHDCYAGYPPISKRLGEQGKVLLRFTVTASGAVTGAKVQKSSGYSRLDHAAVSCVSGWQYKPATQGGKAIAIATQAEVTYRLQ